MHAAFGVDSMLSFTANRTLGRCTSDGILVASGHTATHVIPIIAGEPIVEASCRTPVGGFHSTLFLRQLFGLTYPQHSSILTWESVEAVKQADCYVALDYLSELQLYQAGGEAAKKELTTWQLPWTAATQPDAKTAEELARRAAAKEKNVQRLRDMAAQKRVSKVAILQDQLAKLEQLRDRVQVLEGQDATEQLLRAGVPGGFQELDSSMEKARSRLRKAKGEKVEDEPQRQLPDTEDYPLLNAPDSQLAPEKIKEKRRQRLMKNAAEGRKRAKQLKEEQMSQAENVKKLNEQRWLENPEQYLEESRARYASLKARVEQRKLQRQEGGSLALGRGERHSAAHKDRMRLITSAAFDKGRGEDTFGADDSDWLLYSRISKDGEGGEDEGITKEEEVELALLTQRLQEIDQDFVPPSRELSNGLPGPRVAEVNTPLRLPQAEDFQITLGVARIRAPEILFQPSIVAVDQAGLGEMLGHALRRTPEHLRQRAAEGTLLLTGGNVLYPGTAARVEAEYRKLRPLGSSVQVVMAQDPALDAWQGGQLVARLPAFAGQTFSKLEYEEKGADWLRQYRMQYSSF
eukprot:SM000034S12730  [mRNA]  locus=s34:458727:461937:+ [translate_table: standard]